MAIFISVKRHGSVSCVRRFPLAVLGPLPACLFLAYFDCCRTASCTGWGTGQGVQVQAGTLDSARASAQATETVEATASIRTKATHAESQHAVAALVRQRDQLRKSPAKLPAPATRYLIPAPPDGLPGPPWA
jgi:hypothetical protein